ncbi:unnamed protein product [Vitrella brassicaformis CCMP3155]|uniref:Uncharacterized protein n=1 Tax=Vitrella brassicaformis (strain CCMP3155) TaxID=1169540 RepID=A0A0G4EHG1_VITBC|nr:unnamed protein product [Vitrella brassicaformis CCMP3155]|eukprot:CEL95418.1 unnamed protein product [Vitrella brassicaformis CCMP3155]
MATAEAPPALPIADLPAPEITDLRPLTAASAESGWICDGCDVRGGIKARTNRYKDMLDQQKRDLEERRMAAQQHKGPTQTSLDIGSEVARGGESDAHAFRRQFADTLRQQMEENEQLRREGAERARKTGTAPPSTEELQREADDLQAALKKQKSDYRSHLDKQREDLNKIRQQRKRPDASGTSLPIDERCLTGAQAKAAREAYAAALKRQMDELAEARRKTQDEAASHLQSEAPPPPAPPPDSRLQDAWKQSMERRDAMAKKQAEEREKDKEAVRRAAEEMEQDRQRGLQARREQQKAVRQALDKQMRDSQALRDQHSASCEHGNDHFNCTICERPFPKSTLKWTARDRVRELHDTLHRKHTTNAPRGQPTAEAGPPHTQSHDQADKGNISESQTLREEKPVSFRGEDHECDHEADLRALQDNAAANG